jgi:hypothetical protein
MKMRPIFDTCALGVGYEFISVNIVSGGKWLIQIGRIELVDWLHNRYEVQYRYLNGNFGGLAWTHFRDVPFGHYPIRITDWRHIKEQNYFESVTYADAVAGDENESVTEDGCLICGNPKSPRAKTCSPKCRKALSRQNYLTA